jgi:hypothetical protein
MPELAGWGGGAPAPPGYPGGFDKLNPIASPEAPMARLVQLPSRQVPDLGGFDKLSPPRVTG